MDKDIFCVRNILYISAQCSQLSLGGNRVTSILNDKAWGIYTLLSFPKITAGNEMDWNLNTGHHSESSYGLENWMADDDVVLSEEALDKKWCWGKIWCCKFSVGYQE